MANEVKILVACGSGVATSTVAQEAVKKILADANIPGEYSYAAEPPVQFRLSHLSRRSEPL